MPIRNLIFDLGNVLVPFDWHIAVRRLLRHLPPDLAYESENDPAVFARRIIDLIDLLEKGLISFDDFYGKVLSRTGMTVELAEFRDIWCRIFKPDYQMTTLGQQLSKKYDTWLASNTDEAHFSYIIQNFPEIKFYKKAALSYKMGTKKPESEYFVKALELFCIDPEDSIFIDDLIENVRAAEKTGIIAIQFSNITSLVEELTKNGVVVPTEWRNQVD
ncbi:MAG: HAD family hydrolase [Desulfomonilaceae bacterium]